MNFNCIFSSCNFKQNNIEEKEFLKHLQDEHKLEIIEISKRIGTYEISAMPYGDCCSYFLAKHPTLKADVKLLEKKQKLWEYKENILIMLYFPARNDYCQRF